VWFIRGSPRARAPGSRPSQRTRAVRRASAATRQTRLLPSGRQLRLAGFGYLGIIAVAIVAGAAMVAGPHRLARAAASGLAAAAMAGYVLPRALPGGFLGDHGDVGNWRCPLGIAALSALGQAASPPRPVNPRQLLAVLVDKTRQPSRS
jgi:hypothetical protein